MKTKVGLALLIGWPVVLLGAAALAKSFHEHKAAGPYVCRQIAYDAKGDTVSLAEVCAPQERWSRAFTDSQRVLLHTHPPQGAGVKIAP